MTKIASWNVNSIKVRLPAVLQWIKENPIDILALQETKTIDDLFPVKEIEAAGYCVNYTGQKTYNGVAILSKKPVSDVVSELPNFSDIQKRFLAVTTDQDVRIVNVYVPNGSEVGSEKYEYKLNWLLVLHDFLKQELLRYPKLVVLGDFNIAPDDRDVHDPKAWEGNVLVSDAERKAFQKILSLGFHDSFRLFDQAENLFSWWDYRTYKFRKQAGLRIDLILVSQILSGTCCASMIDAAMRATECPSDHVPVMVELNPEIQ